MFSETNSRGNFGGQEPIDEYHYDTINNIEDAIVNSTG